MKASILLSAFLTTVTVNASAITIDWGFEGQSCAAENQIVADFKVGSVIAEISMLGIPVQIKEAQILSVTCNTYAPANSPIKAGGTIAVMNLGTGYYLNKHLKTATVQIHGVDAQILQNDYAQTKFLPLELNQKIWSALSESAKALALSKSALYPNLVPSQDAAAIASVSEQQQLLVRSKSGKVAFSDKAFVQKTKLFAEGLVGQKITSVVLLDGAPVAANVTVEFVGCSETKQDAPVLGQQLVFECSGATESVTKDVMVTL